MVLGKETRNGGSQEAFLCIIDRRSKIYKTTTILISFVFNNLDFPLAKKTIS